MNSHTDPAVSELLKHLHVEVDAEMPELRDTMRTCRQAKGGNDQTSEDRYGSLQEFYQPINRGQGRFVHQTVWAVRPECEGEFGASSGTSAICLAAGLRDSGAGTLDGSELIEKKATTACKDLVSAGLEGLADIRTHVSGPEQLSAHEISPDCEIL